MRWWFPGAEIKIITTSYGFYSRGGCRHKRVGTIEGEYEFVAVTRLKRGVGMKLIRYVTSKVILYPTESWL